MPRTRALAPPGQKHCHRCGRDRLIDEFARDASKSDGRRVCCRRCDAKRHKAGYWTKERKKALKVRQALAERRALEHKHGRLWLAQQDKLKAQEDKAKRAAQLQARRDAAARRFFARLLAQREGLGGEQS